MSDLQIFNFEEKEIRTVIKNGEVWFVGIDVCRVLGYERPNDALADYCDDSVKYRVIDSLGRNRETYIVSESDLYNLIFRSKMPKAKEFRKWVTKEVLPSIRKTGKYEVKKSLSDIKAHEITGQFLLEISKKIIALEEENKKLENTVEEQKPKVEAYDRIIETGDSIKIEEFAKVYYNELGLGRNKLFEKLRELKILKSDNKPYQEYMHYFEIFERVVPIEEDKEIVKFVTKVKVEKQEDLLKLLLFKLGN